MNGVHVTQLYTRSSKISQAVFVKPTQQLDFDLTTVTKIKQTNERLHSYTNILKN